MDGTYYLQLLVTGITVGSIYAAVALGFTIIFRVTGILNFAQGEFVMIGGMVFISLRLAGAPLLVAAIGGSLAGLLAGGLMELVTIRPARNATHLSLLLITIGTAEALRGGAMLVFGERQRHTEPFSGSDGIRLAGAVITPQAIWVVSVVLSTVAIFYFVIERTKIGRALRACSSDPMMAQLVGIRLRRMALLSFALSGLVGALAGLLIAPLVGMRFDTGLLLGIKGIAAAVLGGFGKLPGAVVGGISLGLLEAVGAAASPGYKDAFALTVVILVLLLFPRGLMGRRTVVAGV